MDSEAPSPKNAVFITKKSTKMTHCDGDKIILEQSVPCKAFVKLKQLQNLNAKKKKIFEGTINQPDLKTRPSVMEVSP